MSLFLLIEYFDGGIASHWRIVDHFATMEDVQTAKEQLLISFKDREFKDRFYAEIREIHIKPEIITNLSEGFNL